MKDKEVVKLRKNNFFKNSIFIPFILLIAVLIALSFSPLFNITKIKVEGNLRLTENSIINASDIKIGHNILRLNKNVIKENIKKLPYIEDASIRRKWPDTIVISVIEKNDFAKLEVLGSTLTIDENGIVLQAFSDSSIIDVPLIDNIEIVSYGINKTINSPDYDKLNNVLEVLKILKKNDMLHIVEKVSKDTSIIIYTQDGHVIDVGDTSDLDYKCKRLKAILEIEENEKYYFDVSNINSYPISKPLWTITEEKQNIEVIE
jgi:cell division protein FtsQ